MAPVRPRTTVLATVLAAGTLGLTGCGLLPGATGADDPPPVDDGPQKSRERVQGYLDAMKVKDVQAGRGQLCAPLHAAFDKAATGPNGDFAGHFTVASATITDVRAAGRDQEVSAAVTVNASGQRIPVRLLFTVTRGAEGGQWCIAQETVGGNASATPAAPAVTP